MKRPSNLLLAVLAVLAACASPAAVMAADHPQATKAAVGDEAASPSKPPMVIRNSDGTFTVQKAPPKDGAKGTAQKGLVIPPQVVVPIVAAPERRK
jgi:hypothetical protein